ncbi:hypothetical protein BBP40_010031 [Aspergillus hancockii]|nr:hypothetical protein BBP40_010031 [Aspergillus hancockii]
MSPQQSFKPSSSTEGFFQALPTVLPAYTFSAQSQGGHPATSDDVAFARVLDLYLPPDSSEARQSIHHLARRALQPSILRHGVEAETNQPTLRPLTTFGAENRVDPLWVTEGWKALKAIGQEEGLVAAGYNPASTWNRRVHQFALNHVWTSSAAMTGCPASMTDGAAKLLQAHLDDADGDQPGRAAVLAEAWRRLISRDRREAWTSGQWMTERTGGSDVRLTETVARRLTLVEMEQEAAEGRERDAHGMPLGPWRIDGFKWFSSATDSDMALMLARTDRGLSLFLIPMRRTARSGEPELNGIRIQRLKNKLGTKQLPTAELELKGVRGWLIGDEGRGVKEISTILNITRLYTASGSVAGWGRGLAICRAYTRIRQVQGHLLQDSPLHVRWMADQTVQYYAALHFTFFGLALQGATEQEGACMHQTKAERLIPQDRTQAATLLRLIIPAMKALVTVSSCQGLRECMEGLGGVGYCENNEDGGVLNISRIFRDTLVNPIWEGTVNVMAEDVVRVILDKRLGGGRVMETVLADWVRPILRTSKLQFPQECAFVEKRLGGLVTRTQSTSKEEMLWQGRQLLEDLGVVVCSTLLIFDACSDGDGIAIAVATRYITSKARLQDSFAPATKRSQEQMAVDSKIFLGASTQTLMAKL